jgi:signal peptidase I
MDIQRKSIEVKPWWGRALIGRNPKKTMVRALIVGLACIGIFKYILIPVRIAGDSMAPTYTDGGFNFVNCLSYVNSPPQRGDVVAIRTTGTKIMYLKRIIGTPGNEVSIKDGLVYIDKAPLAEPYLQETNDWDEEASLLGPEEYYVLGDNRTGDIEDQEHGRIDRNRIVGKIVL